MNTEQFVGFALFAFVASVTPGPNNVLLTAVGGAVGIRRGLSTLWGIALGFAAMIFVVALGVGQTAVVADQIFAMMRIVGIAVLLWLAWQIASAPVEDREASENKHAMFSRQAGFIGAALFQWVNPKAWLICAAAISANLHPDGNIIAQASTFSIVFIVAAILGCFPWLAFGSVLRHFLKSAKQARIFNITMAMLLIASMVPIIFPDLLNLSTNG